jgi:hypothetical protein
MRNMHTCAPIRFDGLSDCRGQRSQEPHAIFCSAMLTMKNGESVELRLKLLDSQAFAADFGEEELAGCINGLKL